MLCVKCKKEIADGSVFCNWCGKKQATEKRKSRRRANSQGSVYKVSGNRRKPYLAVLPCKYDREGKAKRTSLGYYETKTEALNALNEAVANNMTDRINMSLENVFENWKSTHYRDLSKQAVDAYNAAWKYINTYSSKKFKDLRASDIQVCIDDAVKLGKSKATCDKIRSLYSQLCKYAMSQDIVTQNYAQFLKMPKSSKKEKDIFTEAEIKSLLSHDSEETAMIILILLFSGMRIGELFDIKKEMVYLNDTPPRIIGGKKTEAGTNRIIPIHSSILKYVQYFYSKTGKYLISNAIGNRMSEKNFRERNYYPYLKKLGIPKKTPHSTRHTFATMLQACGAKPEDLIKVIGHADYETTTENYIHQDISKLADMVELLKIDKDIKNVE